MRTRGTPLLLLHDCRAIVRQLEPGHERQESASEEAERVLCYGLVGAIEDGLVRTAEHVLAVLRQASRPLGPRAGAAIPRTS